MPKKRPPKKFWSTPEDNHLKRLWSMEKMPIDQIARILDRTTGAIYARRKYLGLEPQNTHNWDERQEQKFARLYVGTRLSLEDIAQLTGRTVDALNTRAQLMDLNPRQKAWQNPDLIMQVFNIPQPEAL